MDPRSPATLEILTQQFELGTQIFGETQAARRALSEILSVQKQLAEAQRKLGKEKSEAQTRTLESALTDAQSGIGRILRNKEHANDDPGLQMHPPVWHGPAVVESGDRACLRRRSRFIRSRAKW